MAAPTLTEALDNLYTTTWQNMKDTVKDQIFDSMPFWFWLKDKGKLRPVQGGRFISEPLQYDKNDNVTWVSKGDAVSLNDYEFMTIAKYDWKYLAAPIVRFGVDDQQNRGKNQIINLMNSKLNNTRNSLINELETRLAGTASGNQMAGLQDLVADTPTNSVGGLSGSTYSWWKNQTTDMTGESFATYGIARMRTILNNCMNNLGMDRPDIIVTGQTEYEYYEDNVLDHYRVTNNKLADMGFQNQTFKGIPMIWTPSISQRMYFLNTNFLTFVYDPMLNFDMTEWKPIPDQINDRVAQIILGGELVTSRRRCQGVIHTIDTA